MKKFLILILLFSCNFVSASEKLKRGQCYWAKEEVLVFTLPELNKLKEKIENAERQTLVAGKYKELAETVEKVNQSLKELLQEYKDLDLMRQESIRIHREALSSYKEIIEDYRSNNHFLQQQVIRKHRESRFKRNLNFLLGVAVPILGAKAWNWVK